MLTLKVAPPALKVPAWEIPPLKIILAVELTAVEVKAVPTPMLTLPASIVIPALLESVNPPLVARVVVPEIVRSLELEQFTITPVMATLLLKVMAEFPDIDWLFVLKVAPPPLNEPLLFATPPLKTILDSVVTAVEVQVPVLFVTKPPKIDVPVLLLSSRDDPTPIVVVPAMVIFPAVLKVTLLTKAPILRLPDITSDPPLIVTDESKG